MAPTSKRTQGVRVATLGWGLAASLILVGLTAGVSILEVSRARTEVLHVFRSNERSTYLIGHIAHELSRMRLLLREQVRRTDPSTEVVAGQVAQLDRSLESAARELPPLLNPEEARLWEELEPRIEAVRANLRHAASLIHGGASAEASAFLDDAIPESTDLVERLAALSRLNREGTDRALARADQRLRVLRFVEVAIALLLLAGIATVWLLAIRLIRFQQQQVDEYLARVEAMNSDLNAFAGRVAHDLKNVLSPLALASAMLRRVRDEPERVEAAAARVEGATRRALGVVDALLAFSRAGKVQPSGETCSVKAEVRTTLEELAPLAERVGATVAVEAPTDPVVRCAGPLLHIVLLNVIGNALKFLDGRARREVRVEVSTEETGSCLIAVGDTGPGIPETAVTRIFEPFFRVPGTTAPGTGIGLSTVLRIVEAHQGTIRVDSVVGQGTRFDIRLPLAAASTASGGADPTT